MQKLGFMPFKKTTLAERNSRDLHFSWLVNEIEFEQYRTLALKMKVSPIELQYYALKLVSGKLNRELFERESNDTSFDDEFQDGIFPYG